MASETLVHSERERVVETLRRVAQLCDHTRPDLAAALARKEIEALIAMTSASSPTA